MALLLFKGAPVGEAELEAARYADRVMAKSHGYVRVTGMWRSLDGIKQVCFGTGIQSCCR